MELLKPIFLSLDVFFLIFFLVVNVMYLLMDLFSGIYMVQRDFRRPTSRQLSNAAHQPAVSIVVPAYNEEDKILDTVWSLLKLEYESYEVIVVNDGSTDGTLDKLRETFDLSPFPGVYRDELKTERVNKMYRSERFDNLKVIDKENGGKHDALNTGINVAEYPLLCVIDGDSLLSPDSLWRVTESFVRHPDTVAVGGSVRILNDCVREEGEVKDIEFPWNPWVIFQNIEYLRAFLFGRVCWNYVNGLMIISGAFGIFRKDALIEVGGYKDTHSNDMEMVVRLHDHMSEKGESYRIRSLPEPICWTEVPATFTDFFRQRVSWQKGLADSLTWNSGLFLKRGSGGAGWIGYPYMLFMEGIEAFVEMLGYIYMVVGWSLGIVTTPILLLFLWVAIGLGTVHSVVSLVLEETHFRQFPKKRQIVVLFFAAILENIGFRQLNTFCRCVGLMKWMFGSKVDPGDARPSEEPEETAGRAA